MRVRGIRRDRHLGKMLVAAFMVSVLLLAACGSSAKKTKAKVGGGGGTTAPRSIELGQGVTDTEIRIGIVMVDYETIKDFIDFNRGDQQKTYQAIVDWINDNGGVGGRKLVPYYQIYLPIGSVGPTKACTSLTEDSKVFATVGVLIDQTGAAQLCFARDHKSILITHELAESIVKQAPPGLLLTSDILAERVARTLLNLLSGEGKLKNKKVAILAEKTTQSRIDAAIKPTLQKLKVPMGTTAVLDIQPTPDTTAAQAQLDSFIEKWKGEGVNAIFVSGLDTVSKQFVQKLRAGLPNVMLMTDADASAKGAAQDAVHAGVKPNPYEHMYALTGQDDQTHFLTPRVQKCVKAFEAKTGTPVVAPKDLKPGADGKRAEIYVAVQDACGELTFFKIIAEKVGKYLDNQNWTSTVDSFGSMNNVLVNTDIASLKTGKYDADNGFSLVTWDSSIGDGGDWKALTPLKDISASG